jgi:WD40 repeat protein
MTHLENVVHTATFGYGNDSICTMDVASSITALRSYSACMGVNMTTLINHPMIDTNQPSVSASRDKPVILLAFANDLTGQVGVLRKLDAERDLINLALQPALSLCEPVVIESATLADILDAFRKYRDRIQVFHYAGHANGFQLLLETDQGGAQAAFAGGLAEFLGQQHALQLVFLNGCSTEGQVDGLLEAHVPAVIATSQAIDDAVACEFANQFYRTLAGGATLQTAFVEAGASLKAQRGGETRHLYGTPKAASDRWPWQLSLRPGAEATANWNLPLAANDPLFGLPAIPEHDSVWPESPFRNLNWFRREDAHTFFGRGSEIRQLFELTTSPQAATIILLYGQSGVGKSSLLEAGLCPRLKTSHIVYSLRRDRNLGMLETVLHGLGAPAGTNLLDAWNALQQSAGNKRVLVILDQLEEVFTTPGPEQIELEAFLGAWQNLLESHPERFMGKLILGFRKEWLAEFERRLEERRLAHEKVFLRPLEREGIIEAIRGPTLQPALQAQYNLVIEPDLPEQIATDLLADTQSPIAPLLQVLLSKMWERAKQDNPKAPQFTRDLYEKLSTSYAGFLDQQLLELQRWRPALIKTGLALDLLEFHTTVFGTADQHPLNEVQRWYGTKPVINELIKQCKASFLLVDSPDEFASPVTRLAHDTLAPLVRERFQISSMPGPRAQRILRRTLDHDKPTDLVLDDRDLGVVEQGLTGTRALNVNELALLGSSRIARQWRRVQRSLIAVVSVAALAAGVLAWRNGQDAVDRTNQAQASQLITRAQDELSRNIPLALLLSLEAARINNTLDVREKVLSTLQAIDPRVKRILTGHTHPVWALGFSADGKRLASAGQNVGVVLWDTTSGQPEARALEPSRSSVGTHAVHLDSTGRTLTAVLEDETIVVVDLASQTLNNTFLMYGKTKDVPAWSRQVTPSVTFSQDGKTLAIGVQNLVQIWQLEPQGWQQIHTLNVTNAGVRAVALNANASLLATSDTTKVTVWDLNTLKPQPSASAVENPTAQKQIDPGPTAQVTALAFNPNGQTLALGRRNGEIILWDITEPLMINKVRQRGEALKAHRTPIDSLVFHSENQLASAAERPRNATINGSGLVSGGTEIILWDLSRKDTLAESLPGTRGTLAISGDGEISLAQVNDGLELRGQASNVPTPAWLQKQVVNSAAISPDASFLALGKSNDLEVWDLKTNSKVWSVLNERQGDDVLYPISLSFSRDNRTLAMTSKRGTVTLWRIPEGEKLTAQFSASSVITLSSDAMIQIGAGLAFHPNETLLAGGAGREIHIWDLSRAKTSRDPVIRLRLNGSEETEAVSFSPDGKILAAANGTNVYLWDWKNEHLIGQAFKNSARIKQIAFAQSGESITTIDAQGMAISWQAGLKGWQQIACQKANRNLSEKEFHALIDKNAYRQTCSDFPGPPQTFPATSRSSFKLTTN